MTGTARLDGVEDAAKDEVAITVVRPRPLADVGAFFTRCISFVLGDWTGPFNPAAVEVRDLRTGVVCLRRNFLSGADAENHVGMWAEELAHVGRDEFLRRCEARS
jgi:hypothetical protein